MPNRQKLAAVTAVSALKTVFAVAVVATAAASFGTFAVPYFVSLWKSVAAGVVPRYLFLVINSIIIVVWKLRGAAQRHVDDDSSLNEDFMPYRTSSSGSQSFASRLPVDIEEDVALSVGAVPTDDSERCDCLEESLGPDNDDKSPPEDASEEDDDSMDAMWKAITGGRPFPNTKKNLTKSDTWEKTEASVASPTLARSSAAVGPRFGKSNTFRERAGPNRPKKEMRKSETFLESSSHSSSTPARSTGWRGRDRLVIGHDELFGKVEAFIKKNYEQMRLQRHERQESIRMDDTAY